MIYLDLRGETEYHSTIIGERAACQSGPISLRNSIEKGYMVFGRE